MLGNTFRAHASINGAVNAADIGMIKSKVGNLVAWPDLPNEESTDVSPAQNRSTHSGLSQQIHPDFNDFLIDLQINKKYH